LLLLAAAKRFSADALTALEMNGVDRNDKVCFYSYRFHVHALSAVLLKRHFLNSTFVTRAHGYDLYTERSTSGYIPFHDSLVRYLTRIFTISKHGNTYLRKRYPHYADKIQTAYLGVNDPVRKNPVVRSGVLSIMSCSRISPEKRVDRMISVFERFKVPVTWIHFGGGEELERLKELAERKSNNSRVFMFTGHTENKVIHEFMANNHVDWFVNVSETEGLPVTMMEAMSYGIPVVGTRVGGVPEIVDHGVNGYLLEKNFTDDDLFDLFMMLSELSVTDIEEIRLSPSNTNQNSEETVRILLTSKE